MKLTLEDILRETKGTFIFHKKKIKKIETVSTDTRTIRKNQLFISLTGQNYQGVLFCLDAYKKGCRLFVVQTKDYSKVSKELLTKKIVVILVKNTLDAYQSLARFYLKSFAGTKIAITGSAGKTMTKQLLGHFLNTKYKVFVSKKNENNQIGIPKNIFLIKKPSDFFIFEFGMNHRGEIKRLSWIVKPNITLITNILPAHLEFFKNLNEIAKAKSEIFKYQKKSGMAFLNQHSKELSIQKKYTISIKKTFFFDSTCLSVISSFGKKMHFFIQDRQTKNNYPCPIINPMTLSNLEAALRLAEVLSIPRQHALQSLKKFQMPKRRFTMVCKKPLVIDDAYNANPASIFKTIEGILTLFETVKKKNFHIVLGDVFELGVHMKACYLKMALQLSDLLKTKKPNIFFYFIGKEIKMCYDKLIWVDKQYFLNQASLISILCHKVKKDSIVLFKASNGMKFNQLIKEFLCFIT